MSNEGTNEEFLYRREQLLVDTDELSEVRGFLSNAGFDIALDPEDPGLNLRRLMVTGQGVLHALSLLEARPAHKAKSVQLNHVFTGLHGNLHGPVTRPTPARPPAAGLQRSLSNGIVVGLLDTGIAGEGGGVDHPFLSDRCNLEDGSDTDSPYGYRAGLSYEAGHGTFIAGIVLRMDPACRVIAARVLSSDGVTDDWTVAAALIRMVKRNAPSLHVVNLSLGGYTRRNEEPLALEEALVQVARAGIVVVAAAGNIAEHPLGDPAHTSPYSPSREFWPASLPQAIGVGALETKSGNPAPLQAGETLALARYNALTPRVRFAAVGDWISTFGKGPGWPSRSGYFDGWARWEGSSFAAAAVSGAIASLLGAQKKDTTTEIETSAASLAIDARERAVQMLEDSASSFREIRPVTDPNQDNWQIDQVDATSSLVAISPDVEPMPDGHGAFMRGSASRPPAEGSSNQPLPGRFGYMFPGAAVLPQSKSSLQELAGQMIVPSAGFATELENLQGALPAGYTFFGQFIDHDLTFDSATARERRQDPAARINYRTPRLDLDSLYGRGPAEQPYMYETRPGGFWTGVRFLMGEDGYDLPRNCEKRALIGDPRNDENLVTSQLHGLFLKFHNRLVEVMSRPPHDVAPEDLFEEVQKQVRWHYQWLVVNDFLPKIVGRTLMSDLIRFHREEGLDSGYGGPDRLALRCYKPGYQPFIPVEFSVGAYRFGHSLLRPSYQLNDSPDGVMLPLFGSEEVKPGDVGDLRGFRAMPKAAKIQWAYFFKGAGRESGIEPQMSLKIDEKLADPLANLPESLGKGPSLAERSLMRGSGLLPSGQAVALAMGLEPLPPEALDPHQRIPRDLTTNTPLWYYILREADVQCEGHQLGEVGGRIVAEVMLGLLAADEESYLRANPGFKPLREVSPSGEFEMAEFVNYALGAPAADLPVEPVDQSLATA